MPNSDNATPIHTNRLVATNCPTTFAGRDVTRACVRVFYTSAHNTKSNVDGRAKAVKEDHLMSKQSCRAVPCDSIWKLPPNVTVAA